MDAWTVACVQTNACACTRANSAHALDAVRRAAALGARLVAFPELCTVRGDHDAIRAAAEPVPGPTTDRFSALAREHGAAIVIGSMPERSPDPARPFNTCVIIAPCGTIAASYRKRRLFDAKLPGGGAVRESDLFSPGTVPCVARLPGLIAGVAICFDLRFPGHFLACCRSGPVDAFFVPSNFTQRTGIAHWHALLRARAIEHQAYVIAPNQCGVGDDGIQSYGHSLVVDPWGEVLADAGQEEGMITAFLDPARLHDVRARMRVDHS